MDLENKTINPAKEKGNPVKFKSRNEAEDHCKAELGITLKQYNEVSRAENEMQGVFLQFYQWANKNGLRFNGRSDEIAKRRIWATAFISGLSKK